MSPWQNLCKYSPVKGVQIYCVWISTWQIELMLTKLQQERLTEEELNAVCVSCVVCSVKIVETALQLEKEMAESEVLLGIAEKVR
jgi:hypothetical protein